VPAPTHGTDVISPPRADTDVPVADDLLVEAPAAPTVEKPETAASRLVRLRQRLAGAQGGFGRGLLALLSRDRLDEDTWEAIEDTLLTADVGVAPTQELVDGLRTRLRVDGSEAGDPKSVLRDELVKLVGPDMDRRLQITGADGQPGVVLVVGVNGTGKTTSVGKLARILVAEDKTVVLGAADTFRAAAVEQLAGWAQRAGCEIVTGPEGSDPGSVAFEAVRQGRESGADVIIVDTAGRLHTQDALMAELAKVRRVIAKQLPDAPHETLLTVDATTGQNGLRQAQLFSETVPVDGIVLTKLDGTAKGGIALAIAGELGIPVKLIGIGEALEDLRPFDADDFAAALVELRE
jgi:fused signal recognition particle receptor